LWQACCQILNHKKLHGKERERPNGCTQQWVEGSEGTAFRVRPRTTFTKNSFGLGNGLPETYCPYRGVYGITPTLLVPPILAPENFDLVAPVLPIAGRSPALVLVFVFMSSPWFVVG